MENTKPSPACSFTELAIRYNPYISVKSARRILRHWISINQPLQTELAANGYLPGQRMLTPKQINVVYKYIGEP